MSKTTVALTTILADTYALAVKTHAAHWNVTGSGFFELHAAFGSQYEALLAAADELAERIRALGDGAPVGLKALAKLTTVADIESTDGRELAKSLREDHRAMSKVIAKAVAVAQKGADEGTADLLIGRSQEHDKTAWMLSAYAAK